MSIISLRIYGELGPVVLSPGGCPIGASKKLAIDPFTGTTLYAGTFIGELFKSTDGGITWTPLTVTQ